MMNSVSLHLFSGDPRPFSGWPTLSTVDFVRGDPKNQRLKSSLYSFVFVIEDPSSRAFKVESTLP